MQQPLLLLFYSGPSNTCGPSRQPSSWNLIRSWNCKPRIRRATASKTLRGFRTGIMFNNCSMGGRALLNLDRAVGVLGAVRQME